MAHHPKQSLVIREMSGRVTLDQCWDLLRQWRAQCKFGQDPDEARPRDEKTVEGYVQADMPPDHRLGGEDLCPGVNRSVSRYRR